MMNNVQAAVAALEAEQTRITNALRALIGDDAPPTYPAGVVTPVAGGNIGEGNTRKRTAAQKASQSEKMKAYWAKRRREKAKAAKEAEKAKAEKAAARAAAKGKAPAAPVETEAAA